MWFDVECFVYTWMLGAVYTGRKIFSDVLLHFLLLSCLWDITASSLEFIYTQEGSAECGDTESTHLTLFYVLLKPDPIYPSLADSEGC
jgi:hypothetical protein